jgi:serralysin
MMFDIAALQALYGANFSKVGMVANYTWDKTTGQELINGRPAPLTGTTSTDKIFSTVWTMGAATTYDLTNFTDNQSDDLRPGHWLTFSHAQLADLNNAVAAGTAGFQAQGNVYNALLYHNDLRSEVSNLITGSGNDTIWGNDVDNFLKANAGNDTIHAGSGNDTISGGLGADTVYFGTGHDVLRDLVAELNGDTVFNFNGSVDVEGVRFGQEGLHVATTHSAALSTDGSTVQLNGDFSAGDFMISARGSGADAHTSVTFVQFLPTLAEGVSANPASINGIGNQLFLSGDGQVRFGLDFKSAVSAFGNELGFYKVSADGTIHDVHILFGDTLAVTQQSIDLGTPANNDRIGFFLVQNGFDIYGKLPDNLSFVIQGTSNPADLNSGLPVVLHSATLGDLTAAQVFHSFANLNPNHADQVLSGVTPDGHQLTIGFEDLPRATGDNDFQDVVVTIHVTPDDNRIM